MPALPPEGYTTLPAFWAALQAAVPTERPVLHGPEPHPALSYKEVNATAHCLAAWLHTMGIQPGATVAFLADNDPQYLMLDLACQLAGCINLTLPACETPAGWEHKLQAAPAQVLFITRYAIYEDHRAWVDARSKEMPVIVAMKKREEMQEQDTVINLENVIERGKVVWREERATITARTQAVKPSDAAAWAWVAPATPGEPPLPLALSQGNLAAAIQAAVAAPLDRNRKPMAVLVARHQTVQERVLGLYRPLALGLPLLCASSPQHWPAKQDLLLTALPPALADLIQGFIRAEGKTTAKALKLARQVQALREGGKKVRFGQKLKLAFTKGRIKRLRRTHLARVLQLQTDAGTLPEELRLTLHVLQTPLLLAFGFAQSAGLMAFWQGKQPAPGERGTLARGAEVAPTPKGLVLRAPFLAQALQKEGLLLPPSVRQQQDGRITTGQAPG